ncbi:hypothetical protein RhiirA4_471453 [Rhizophagus irregularis]|uniref:Uncharacterized protein n=1 Tax=Rhizophagus irregularis TaxID=588596 RepID=A0A2I1H357_9GLOM|nr:hypothetical protein RhiirA4_471453 [Rhizophagus irregularis]
MKDHEVIVGLICYLGEPQVLNVETPFRLIQAENIVSSIFSWDMRRITLLTENDAENAKVKAENAKLRQAMEKNEARLAKLVYSDKEKAKFTAELNERNDTRSIISGTTQRNKSFSDYIIVQDFVQDVSSELIDEDDIQIIDGNQELTTDMTISRTSNPIILDYFNGSGYADTELKKPNSYSGCKNVENVRPKVPFEKSHESVPKKLPYVVSELPAEASTPTQKEHAGHPI